MQLYSGIKYPKHAIKREDTQYVLSYDIKDQLHQVGLQQLYTRSALLHLIC